MKRYQRILLVVFMLLLALLVLGWVRSRWVGDEVRYSRFHNGDFMDQWIFAHGGGDIALVRWTIDLDIARPPVWEHVRNAPVPVRYNLPDRVIGINQYGVCHYRPTGPNGTPVGTYDAITLPYWLLTLLSTTPWLFVAWRYWRTRAARRIAAGLCGTCGYDLRASSGRCPECGMAAQRAPGPA